MEVIKGRSFAVAATTKTMSSSSIHQQSQSSTSSDQEDNMDLRRGPWTVEEDFKLMNYIANHGEGRWNSLARCAGLKRTGKSCRLRWLNYLRPDVRRGNITLEEQLLILELHSRWGNRWSKIAQHLPGRTDNEIKNYWRTRVQKHAKQLKCDVNSKQFKDAMRYLWMPRLMERIQAANATATSSSVVSAAATHSSVLTTENNNIDLISSTGHMGQLVIPPMGNMGNNEFCCGGPQDYYTPENSISTAASSDSFGTQVSPVSDLTDYYNIPVNNNPNPDYNNFQPCGGQVNPDYNTLISPSGYYTPGLDFMDQSNQLMDGGDVSTDNLWNVEDIWFLQQQFNNDNNM